MAISFPGQKALLLQIRLFFKGLTNEVIFIQDRDAVRRRLGSIYIYYRNKRIAFHISAPLLVARLVWLVCRPAGRSASSQRELYQDDSNSALNCRDQESVSIMILAGTQAVASTLNWQMWHLMAANHIS